MSQLQDKLKFVRFIHGVLFLNFFFLIIIGEVLNPQSRYSSSISRLLALPELVIPIILLGLSVTVRQKIVLPSLQELQSSQDNPKALGRWVNGQIASFVLCEAAVLSAVAQRFLGQGILHVAPFYGTAVIIMVYLIPRSS
jgi:hypothetical protein